MKWVDRSRTDNACPCPRLPHAVPHGLGVQKAIDDVKIVPNRIDGRTGAE